MFLQKLVLNNYRVHRGLCFAFDPGVNLIVGENAKGKTSILEAVHLLICGRPFRHQQLNDVIQISQKEFSIEAHFIKSGLDHRLSLGSDGKRKKIVHNRTTHQSIAPLIGLLHGVVMAPDDTTLIKGGPVVRRRYLDIQLSQANGEYFKQLMRYTRAVKQRNQLLRNKDLRTIEIWEKELVQAGEYLINERLLLVEKLRPLVQSHFSTISCLKCILDIQYKAQENLASLYKNQREREILLGSTLFGPHRDDLMISIDGKPAKQFASLGQLTLTTLALRFAEWERLKCEVTHAPMLLIDDLGMHLDPIRTNGVIEHLKNLQSQIFITTTRRESFPSEWSAIVVN
ncbi:MAG: DNA replication/repair protein RecF [Waddliaceae bacterium]